MRTFRILLGLLFAAVGGLAATIMGFQMLLTGAYGASGLAFAYCMGTALASMVLCMGGYVMMGRWPGFMVYTSPAPRSNVPSPTPVSTVSND
jgi:hypothetical protein